VAIAGLVKLLRNVAFFDLNSRVINVKSLSRDTVHPGEKTGAIVIAFSHDMAAHGQHA